MATFNANDPSIVTPLLQGAHLRPTSWRRELSNIEVWTAMDYTERADQHKQKTTITDKMAHNEIRDEAETLIKVFGNSAHFGLPDVSPFVTKVIFFLKITKTPYEYVNQDMSTLQDDAPFGKLPYIVTSKGIRIGDSNDIIQYLEEKCGIGLDFHLSASERAISLAFDRLIGEHLYWSGVVRPRWVSHEGYKAYIPILLDGAELTPELQGFCDGFRQGFIDQYKGHGTGRRPEGDVLRIHKQDIDATSDFLADKMYFMGNKISRLDATTYSILRHCNDQPINWDGSGYVATKQNLKDYMSRMRQEFDM